MPAQSDSLPAFRLEARKNAWRLAVDVAGEQPEVELSASEVRLHFQDSSSDVAKSVTLPVPKEAQPLDWEQAKCSFSRKRCELCIDWPQSLKVVAPSHADTTASESDTEGAEKAAAQKAAVQKATAAKAAAEKVAAEKAAADKAAASKAAAEKAVAEKVAAEKAAAQKAVAEATAERAAAEKAVAAATAAQAAAQKAIAEVKTQKAAAEKAVAEAEAAAAMATKAAAEKAATVADVAQEKKSAEAAVADAEKAIAEDSEAGAANSVKSSDEWKALGNAAVKVGDHEEGIRCYSAGLAAGGGDEAVLHSNRALCFSALGRHEEGLEDARRCVALRPDFFKGHVRGAKCLRALGRPEEALALLKQCLKHPEAEALATELKPEAEAAEAARIASLGGAERAKEEGNVLFRKGQFEMAIDKYTKALKASDDEESSMALAIRNNRAACYHQLSDHTLAVKDTNFVLQREPNNFKALFRRMLALEPLERYAAALEDARAILRQDPRNEVANKMQHRLGKLVRDLQRSDDA